MPKKMPLILAKQSARNCIQSVYWQFTKSNSNTASTDKIMKSILKYKYSQKWLSWQWRILKLMSTYIIIPCQLWELLRYLHRTDSIGRSLMANMNAYSTSEVEFSLSDNMSGYLPVLHLYVSRKLSFKGNYLYLDSLTTDGQRRYIFHKMPPGSHQTQFSYD